MMGWLAVGVGGALGSMARHAVNRVVLHHWPALQLPIATIIVNVLGCSIIGVLAGFAVAGRLSIGLYWREFVFVGILGGFTTFSTFGLETITLLRTGAPAVAALNIATQLVGGLAGVQLGLFAVERLFKTTT